MDAIGGFFSSVWSGIEAGFGWIVGWFTGPTGPGIKSPGQSQDDLDITSIEQGAQVFDVMGLAKITGQLIYYCRR